MTTRKIEIMEPDGFLHGKDKFNQGEIRFVEDPWASEFIRLGWAKDVDTGEQGERKPGSTVIQVDDTVQVVTS